VKAHRKISAVDLAVRGCHVDCIHVIGDYLIDSPVDEKEIQRMQSRLGVEAGAKVFCSMDALDWWERPRQLLNTIQYLLDSLRHKLCILLLGYDPSEQKKEVDDTYSTWIRIEGIQVILGEKYINSTSVRDCFSLVDMNLKTSRFQRWSSSAFIRSALAKRPWLSSNYGLRGGYVRTPQLGVTVHSSDSRSHARGCEQMAIYSERFWIDFVNVAKLLGENLREKLDLDLAKMFRESFSPNGEMKNGLR
jgi:hypothetical protein